VVFLLRREIELADVDRLITATIAAWGLAPEQLNFYRELILKDLVNPRVQER
jgi:hypothetical protein